MDADVTMIPHLSSGSQAGRRIARIWQKMYQRCRQARRQFDPLLRTITRGSHPPSLLRGSIIQAGDGAAP